MDSDVSENAAAGSSVGDGNCIPFSDTLSKPKHRVGTFICRT